jgi:hypothetical protein
MTRVSVLAAVGITAVSLAQVLRAKPPTAARTTEESAAAGTR